jgi:hypothetical protein
MGLVPVRFGTILRAGQLVVQLIGQVGQCIMGPAQRFGFVAKHAFGGFLHTFSQLAEAFASL